MAEATTVIVVRPTEQALQECVVSLEFVNEFVISIIKVVTAIEVIFETIVKSVIKSSVEVAVEVTIEVTIEISIKTVVEAVIQVIFISDKVITSVWCSGRGGLSRCSRFCRVVAKELSNNGVESILLNLQIISSLFGCINLSVLICKLCRVNLNSY